MSPGGDDLDNRPDAEVDEATPIRILKLVVSASAAILIISLVALLFAPRDPGTLTMYGLVIGLNLVIVLAFWPALRWLRRIVRDRS
ncbi:MAG TPA: hypothetical protein VD973_08220 [Symbiobacteriaceae bacterium]|jgi:hypothetical protein|nr:hypothetical protein [Symbiobacteriaceae bacterium]